MIPSVAPAVQPAVLDAVSGTRSHLKPVPLKGQGSTDVLSLGSQPSLAVEKSLQVVYERSLERLREVVDEARQAVGLPVDDETDVSPEATADRILDFVFGVAFSGYQQNHEDLSDEEVRETFVQFIHDPIMKGVEEARNILGALKALTPEVKDGIQAVVDRVEHGLAEFRNLE